MEYDIDITEPPILIKGTIRGCADVIAENEIMKYVYSALKKFGVDIFSSNVQERRFFDSKDALDIVGEGAGKLRDKIGSGINSIAGKKADAFLDDVPKIDLTSPGAAETYTNALCNRMEKFPKEDSDSQTEKVSFVTHCCDDGPLCNSSNVLSGSFVLALICLYHALAAIW